MTSRHIKLSVSRTSAFLHRVKTNPDLAVGLSLLRTHLSPSTLPEYVKNVSLPTFGVLRDRLRAYVFDEHRQIVTDEIQMRLALGIQPMATALLTASQRLTRRFKAWSGLGNHPLNNGYNIWSEGNLVYRIDEGPRIATGRPCFCVVIYKDATLAGEECQFTPGGTTRPWNIIIKGRDRSAQVHLAISGPALIRDGVPVDPYSDMTAAGDIADLRHLISGPYPLLIDLKTGTTALDANGKPKAGDYGMDQLTTDPVARDATVRGDIVALNPIMRDVDGQEYTVSIEELLKALSAKSYVAVSNMQELEESRRKRERGRYWLNLQDKVLHIIYRRSPYPHQFLALRKDEPSVLFDFAISGWSNNAGADPLSIATDLSAAGYSAAVLGANGFDIAHHMQQSCLPNAASTGGDHDSLVPVLTPFKGRDHQASFLVYPDAAPVQSYTVLPIHQEAEHETLDMEI